MDTNTFFIVILVFLILLAAFDLFVGVSNDAVNFLNSAIGSRVAPFKIIMIIASVGVLIGATFSSGMMEIARSGVFNPNMFVFNEIIVIFFGVMVADIILLDAFNSFGMPTSTTVSIVFELLGGAVAAATYKILSSGTSFVDNIGAYINNEKAMAIISGILISVVVAFAAGALIQYITRLIFTFNYQGVYKKLGGIFGGIAITAILYFLVMKGAKGASFMKKEYITFINDNTALILLVSLLSLSIVFQCMITFFKSNIFKYVILAGTFALAFAFAGNDLVNFVGVPLAAIDSFNHYQASGLAADAFNMASLKDAVQTPTLYLVLAGVIMVLTLWFSKKAHRVVQTSISLSSSGQGTKEQFGSSMLGRSVVRASLNAGEMLHRVMPNAVWDFLDSRFQKVSHKKGEIALPFDQVRASINLIVASILIASATSLKLPLSTTYVTFMVAMGSSLADGAWDRSSAVYRVSGVLAVIGGWFITAFCAFTLCAVATTFVFIGGAFAVVVLMLIVSFMLIRSNFFSKKGDTTSFNIVKSEKVDKTVIALNVNTTCDKYLAHAIELCRDATNAFQDEDRGTLKTIHNKSGADFEEISELRTEYYRLSLQPSSDQAEGDARHYYYRIFANLKEVAREVRGSIGVLYRHINNSHSAFQGVFEKEIKNLVKSLSVITAQISDNDNASASTRDYLNSCSEKGMAQLDQSQRFLLDSIESEQISLRDSEVFLEFIHLGRALVNRYTLIVLLQRELNDKL